MNKIEKINYNMKKMKIIKKKKKIIKKSKINCISNQLKKKSSYQLFLSIIHKAKIANLFLKYSF